MKRCYLSATLARVDVRQLIYHRGSYSILLPSTLLKYLGTIAYYYDRQAFDPSGFVWLHVTAGDFPELLHALYLCIPYETSEKKIYSQTSQGNNETQSDVAVSDELPW